MAPSVLVIGAGMAGLTAARLIEAGGVAATVVDKGRAVGGRMATRQLGDATFDHGAQHISVRTATFAREMRRLEETGKAKVWIRTPSVTEPERGIEARYVGVEGIRRIPESLAEELSITTGVQVDRLAVETDGVATFAAGVPVAGADALVLTTPIPRALDLLATGGLKGGAVLDELAGIRYNATLAVMAVLDAPARLPDGHVALDTGPVAWIADNQHKGVSAVPALTIHSSAAFAAEHVESDPSEWSVALLTAARSHHDGEVLESVAHRWRYSQPRTTRNDGALLIDAPAPVVLAGEAFAGARVEGAYLSGRAAARLVLDGLS